MRIMSMKVSAIWLTVWSLSLTLALPVFAQQTPVVQDNAYAYGNAEYSNPRFENSSPLWPLNPVGVTQKWQPFAPADISDYGTGPKAHTGFFGSYERLLWSISRPHVATVGSQAAEQVYMENGVPIFERNSLDTSYMTNRWDYGNRYDLGYVDNNDHGWMVSILDHVSQNQNLPEVQHATILFNDPQGLLQGFNQVIDPVTGLVIDADINNNGVFGRDGRDIGVPNPNPPPPTLFTGHPTVAAPTDLGDLQSLVPRFAFVTLLDKTTLNGVELMRLYRAPRLHNGGTFDLIYGARYLQIDDGFAVYGSGGILDQTFVDTQIKNRIIGPQLGGRFSNQRGRWIFSAEGRVMAGFNFQHAKQIAESASNAVPFSGVNVLTSVVTQNQTLNLQGVAANHFLDYNTFAPAAEIRLNTVYQVTRSVGIKVGYTGLFVDGISRASNRVDYTLPTFGILSLHPRQDMLVNGLSIGVEVNR